MPTVVVMKSVCDRHFRPGGGLVLSELRDLSIVIVVLGMHGVVRWFKANSFLSFRRSYLQSSLRANQDIIAAAIKV